MNELQRYGVNTQCSKDLDAAGDQILWGELSLAISRGAAADGLQVVSEVTHDRIRRFTIEGLEYFDCFSWAYVKPLTEATI